MRQGVAPAIALFFLSPLVAEFLLGNVAIDALPAGLFFAPMYGGGAILVREAARHAQRGWPTMILLALAYAVVEEGLVIQTLFNPSYFGFELLREAYIPTLGIGAWWTLFVLTLHTVWSISAPIAIVEAFVPDRATPWLGKTGLTVTSALFVFGVALIFWGTHRQEHFVAATSQLVGAAIVVIVLIVAAFSVRDPRSRSEYPGPGPWKVGAFSFLAASTFLGLRYVLADWPIVAAYLILFGLVAVIVVRWSGCADWGPIHRVALAGGALLTYAWHSFIETPLIGSKGTIDLVGNVVFSWQRSRCLRQPLALRPGRERRRYPFSTTAPALTEANGLRYIRVCGRRSRPEAVRGMPDVLIAPSATGAPQGWAAVGLVSPASFNRGSWARLLGDLGPLPLIWGSERVRLWVIDRLNPGLIFR